MRIAFFCVLGLAGGAVACSADVDDLFGGAAAEGGSGGASGQTTATGPGGQTTGTTGPGGQTTDTTGQTTSTSGPTTSTVTTGQTTTVTTGGPLLPTLSCNDAPCAAGQVCCYFQFEAGQDFCSAPNTCPDNNGWMEITCSGPDDCPGQVCCGTFNNQSWVDVSCQNQCNGGNELTLCSGDPSVCEFGTQCQQSQLLGQGYSYCGN